MKKNEKPPGGYNLSLPKSVGIIYSDVKREYFPTENQYLTEKDAYRDAHIVSNYINKLKIKTYLYKGNRSLSKQLLENKPNMVLNLVGSVRGDESLASAIPGILELLNIPYTGAGILGESLAYNKFLGKQLLNQAGVPTPNCQLFITFNDSLNPTLRFPLISKLNEIHGAVEITKDAISESEKHLRERIKFLINTYKQPVLVEEFIVGREITAYLLEGLNKKVYMGEKIFKKKAGDYSFASFELQWLDTDPDTIRYQKYNDPVLKEFVKKAFDITKMNDYGKFDIRVDASGRYYFLDLNSNPFFGPKEIESPMANILDMYGVSFMDILKRLIINTMRDAANKSLLPIP